MLPILYSFRRCPYAMRARYLIALLNVPVYLREVVLKSKPEALLKLGGRSTVPQLIDVGGKRYPESLDIMYWALSQVKGQMELGTLWPSSKLRQNKIRAWVNYNDHCFKYWLDRYKYADRFPEQSESFYRDKGCIFLNRLEKRLSKGAYLFGEEESLADIAVFPFIRQFVNVNPNWFETSDYENVKVWLARFMNSDLFQKVMTKFPAWDETQESQIFLRRC